MWPRPQNLPPPTHTHIPPNLSEKERKHRIFYLSLVIQDVFSPLIFDPGPVFLFLFFLLTKLK